MLVEEVPPVEEVCVCRWKLLLQSSSKVQHFLHDRVKLRSSFFTQQLKATVNYLPNKSESGKTHNFRPKIRVHIYSKITENVNFYTYFSREFFWLCSLRSRQISVRVWIQFNVYVYMQIPGITKQCTFEKSSIFYILSNQKLAQDKETLEVTALTF